MPGPIRLAALALAAAFVAAALWTLRGPPDADRDGVADAADHCPGTPRDRPAGADGCAAAQRALQRGVEALVRAPALLNIGTVWATQQLLRRLPDPPLQSLAERSVARMAGEPGGRA